MSKIEPKIGSMTAVSLNPRLLLHRDGGTQYAIRSVAYHAHVVKGKISPQRLYDLFK